MFKTYCQQIFFINMFKQKKTQYLFIFTILLSLRKWILIKLKETFKQFKV